MSDCCLCKTKHVNKINFPGCEHVFGQKCLESSFNEKFEKNELSALYCPVKDCNSLLELEKSTLAEILGKEFFKKYFFQCRKCKMLTYSRICVKLSECNHKFCPNCFHEIKSAEEKICPVDDCGAELNEKDIKNQKKTKQICMVCQNKVAKEDLNILECCSTKYCHNCLQIELDSQMGNFTNKKKNKFHCFFCRSNLRSYLVEDIFGEKKYKKYMKKYQKKEQCETCLKYREISKFDDLPCQHRICPKCLSGYIHSELEKNIKFRKIECPIKNCDERLTKKIVENYIDNSEDNQPQIEEEEKKNTHTSKIRTEFKNMKDNLKNEALDVSYEQINPNFSCYNCRIETGHFVKYECKHYLCENDFIQFLESQTNYEELILCSNSECKENGIASLDSIMQLSIPDFKKENLKKLFDKSNNPKNEISGCLFCHKPFNLYDSLQLECGHSLCSACIKTKISERMAKTQEIEKILVCLIDPCQQPMSLDNLKPIISDKIYTALILLQNKIASTISLNQSMNPTGNKSSLKEANNLSKSLNPFLKKSEIHCEICLSKVNIDDCLTLECDHKFCKDCLIGEWTDKIKNGQVDETLLKCPKFGCNQPIEYQILKGNLDRKIFEKYEKFLLNHTLLEASNAGQNNEKTISCPNPKCSQICYIVETADFFICPSCKIQYCSKEDCKGLWKDHKGKSCKVLKDAKKKTNLAQENIMKNEKFIEEQYKKCPVCGIPIEKIKNCNYVRCESQRCQKKTLFCFICGETLIEKNIKFHYMNQNPYSPCIKYKPEPKNSTKILEGSKIFRFPNETKNEQLQKIHFNCPKCKNKITDSYCPIKNEKGEEIGNYFLCDSKQCQQKLYCGICEVNILLTEEWILRHGNFEVSKQGNKGRKSYDIKRKCKNCKNEEFTILENVEGGLKCSKCNKYICSICYKDFKDLTSLKTHITSGQEYQKK